MARRRFSAVTTKKVGNWAGTIDALKKMGYNVADSAKWAQTQLASDMKKALIGHIQAQDLNWASLSPKTQKRKKNNKTMVYLDTETYVTAISIVKSGNTVSVGIKKGQTYKKKKDKSVTVDQVALWMEYGTRNMPARPLWGPTIDEFGGATGMRDFVAKAIFNRIKAISRNSELKITYRQVRSLKL